MSKIYYNMNWLYFIAVLDLFLSNGKVLTETDFCNLNTNNILCPNFTSLYQSCVSSVVRFLILSHEAQNITIHTINIIRNEVAGGKLRNISIPEAASMTEMIWDPTLAEAAKVKLQLCTKGHVDVSSRKFGTITAKAMMQFSVEDYNDQSISEEIKRRFENESKYFDGKNIHNYNSSENYDIVSMIMYHKSLFVGCAQKFRIDTESHLMKTNLMCYLAESGNKEDVLYKNGTACSDCPFRHLNYNCSQTYQYLCRRPNWTLGDDRVQNSTFIDGFKPTTTTTTTTSTTTTTTTTTATTTTTTTSTTTTTPTTTPTTTTIQPAIGVPPKNDEQEDFAFDYEIEETTTVARTTTRASNKMGNEGSSESNTMRHQSLSLIIMLYTLLKMIQPLF